MEMEEEQEEEESSKRTRIPFEQLTGLVRSLSPRSRIYRLRAGRPSLLERPNEHSSATRKSESERIRSGGESGSAGVTKTVESARTRTIVARLRQSRGAAGVCRRIHGRRGHYAFIIGRQKEMTVYK